MNLDIDTSIANGASHAGKNEKSLHTPPCFDSTAKYEITHQGRKILASAQRQVGGALLQHGSIKLFGVYHHSALRPTVNPEKQPQLLNRSQFNRLARLFVHTIGSSLGVIFSNGIVSASRQELLRVQGVRIAENPISRRDFIKQNVSHKSLSK